MSSVVDKPRNRNPVADGTLLAEGSGNVFADIGLPNPEEHLVKADLAIRIASVIEERGLTQTEAAVITGVAQPKISLITNGHFGDFSSDRLCRMLSRLGVSVTLVMVTEPDWEPGRTRVAQMDEDEDGFALQNENDDDHDLEDTPPVRSWSYSP